eukprot:6192686-Pleurochrysis_carterae.AAC.2
MTYRLLRVPEPAATCSGATAPRAWRVRMWRPTRPDLLPARMPRCTASRSSVGGSGRKFS